jgi:threonyl-tRNA synthetase
MPAVNDYCQEVRRLFRQKGMHVDVDVGPNTLQKKIREGQLAQYNFVFVCGAQEKESRTVNIRNRDDQATQKLGELVPLDVAMEKLVRLNESRDIENKI